ncbi:MAG: type II secretion system F family protein [Clostridium sp.]|nr:type II secretion system F family protein [Clostridium sp.]
MNEIMAAGLFGIYVFAIVFFSGKVVFRKQEMLKIRLERIQAMGKQEEGFLRMDVKEKRQRRQTKGFNMLGRIQKELDGAGIAVSSLEYLGIWIAAAAILPLGCYVSTRNVAVSGILLAGAALVPPLAVRIIRKRRLEQFSSQLGDALMILGNCLRSGFSIQQSIGRIASDMPEPIAQEFRMAVMEMNYGATLQDALTAVAIRMENKDLDLVTTAIRIQQRVGGNLSEIIDNVSETIKDRNRIRKNLKTLTAQGRMSGMVLGGLPLITLGIMTVINPEYTGTFFTTSFGYKALGLAACMEIAGFYVIYRIVNIRID